MIDLDRYLHRIAYAGLRTPTLAVLEGICAAHPAAIAFENIDPLLGWPPSLALDNLQTKLVAQRRGGYCYEQNTLLRAALLMLGMQVTALAARVLWMQPLDAPRRARSHMLLKVELAADGVFIADAGFGGHLIGTPLRLQPGIAQPTPAGRMRIVQDGDEYTVESPVGSGRFLTIGEAASELSTRLTRIFLRGADGRRPVFGDDERLQNDPNFRDHVLFHEYFHGDSGRGVGASHQTGWTGLVAKLLQVSRSRSQDADGSSERRLESPTVAVTT